MNAETFRREVAEAKKLLLWLSFECPAKGNPLPCPMYAMRFRSFDERRRTLDAMSERELLDLYRQHSSCVVPPLGRPGPAQGHDGPAGSLPDAAAAPEGGTP